MREPGKKNPIWSGRMSGIFNTSLNCTSWLCLTYELWVSLSRTVTSHMSHLKPETGSRLRRNISR